VRGPAIQVDSHMQDGYRRNKDTALALQSILGWSRTVSEPGWANNLYLANLLLLTTHEIDSAYWQEWNLFGLPGGIQVFLLLNLFVLLLAIIGYRQLLLGARGGVWFSLALAAAGLFAFVVHGYFILAGHPEFTLPASLVVLSLTAIVSVAQIAVALVLLSKRRRGIQGA
jgi:hypothetical protein